MTPRSIANFWARVDKTDACWNWIGYVNKEGYGKFATTKRTMSAHRLAYELLIGPIPQGLEIDHLCRNRRCVNPAHMEAVTHRENVLRGEAPSAQHAKKTHCPNGHEYTTVTNKGSRVCRTCINERHQPKPRPTHCKNGHPYTVENTGVHRRDGSRKCRKCAAAKMREWKAKKRQTLTV